MVTTHSSANPAPTVRVVSAAPKSAAPAAASPLEILLELIRRARSADDAAALRFIAVNDSHLLAPYQQAALWLAEGGVSALSGLVEIEENAPYVQWLNRAAKALATDKARAFTAEDLPENLRAGWGEWLPAHGLWIPFEKSGKVIGGLLLARELAWRELDVRLFHEWMQTWHCAYRVHHRPSSLRAWWQRLRGTSGQSRKRAFVLAIAIAATVAFPVRLSVLTSGELIPANPVAIRAPFDGVIKTFFVRPNQTVKAGDPLFAYDDAQLASKLDVALEALRTAEAEQRQYTQQALTDAKARSALSTAKGTVEEKRLEVEFLQSQLERGKILAPRDGIAFVDDPSEWIGRNVSAGQRVMRLAEPSDQEIESWLPVADAIPLPAGSPARLYLSASPLSPVSGKIEYIAYEASRRPDGHYAYRVRAKLDDATPHRVGSKGTVRLSGGRAPLVYWALRRPIAAVREFLGL
ncbi:MAG TPA: HlyD family efflux transporter periplasmic adaptor subunit [Opitutaceae bacterium]|nr:HlyD family efflux transporter periplasmic adaptor subunit [Opitutaceae bacterium]